MTKIYIETAAEFEAQVNHDSVHFTQGRGLTNVTGAKVQIEGRLSFPHTARSGISVADETAFFDAYIIKQTAHNPANQSRWATSRQCYQPRVMAK
jgi:hypothetical protein